MRIAGIETPPSRLPTLVICLELEAQERWGGQGIARNITPIERSLMRILAISAMGLGLVATAACPSAGGEFPDFSYQPPRGWTGPIFELSQSYPAQAPAPEDVPWKRIDFRQQPAEYLNAVITYCFEGNIEIDFVGQKNAVRKWYHAPWLHWGPNGREFVHGLTHERLSRSYELAVGQKDPVRNYAVGLYNAPGGYTIGQVWRDPDDPNPFAATFPEDTASFKLLFTTATKEQVPYLAGAPEWVADIDHGGTAAAVNSTKVRLLQIDVAVKDKRSSAGGWIFGTFHYDADVSGVSPWQKIRPLTLMWGNDPDLTESAYVMGQAPKESWVNPESPIVRYRQNPPAGATPPRVLGWAGRGNGPVDNPLSSCISCHSQAQWRQPSVKMIPDANLEEIKKLFWFRNLALGESFTQEGKSLDFSLQLGVGIQNAHDFRRFARDRGGYSGADFRIRTEAPEAATSGKATPQAKKHRFDRDPERADSHRGGAVAPSKQ